MIFKLLDQYEGICRRAFFGCTTKLNKNIKTNIIEILILIMCIHGKINFPSSADMAGVASSATDRRRRATLTGSATI